MHRTEEVILQKESKVTLDTGEKLRKSTLNEHLPATHHSH
jgi:hypothetical protein